MAHDTRERGLSTGHAAREGRRSPVLSEATSQTPLLTITCRGCGQVARFCRRCFRGQCYCCKRCSAAGRARSLRGARRRYRDSEEGALAHAEAERARRRRRRQERALRDSVGDQGSAGMRPTDAGLAAAAIPPVVHPQSPETSHETPIVFPQQCARCQTTSSWHLPSDSMAVLRRPAAGARRAPRHRAYRGRPP